MAITGSRGSYDGDPRLEEVAERPSMLSVILKNALVAFVLIGGWLAVETGYFSNDRTSRHEWDEMMRLKQKSKATAVYETSFSSDVLAKSDSPVGYWDFYNGASSNTAFIERGAFVLNYTSSWIGAYFRHTSFIPNGVYRVTFEANVVEQPAAILVRNRQLDLIREVVPVTNGEFQEFTHYYVAPNGRLDQVRVIFMPDEREAVKGRMTMRKFRIERLED